MRIFLTILILILSFQSWTKADDIRDFEIEGMSIGDSALNFFSQKQISKYVYDLKVMNLRVQIFILQILKHTMLSRLIINQMTKIIIFMEYLE